MQGHSLLVVPLPALVAAVPAVDWGAAGPHIRLVEPFADVADLDDGTLAELGSYFADVVPFDVRFSGLSQFPGGPAYLSPQPAAPFRRLSRGVVRLFPEIADAGGVVDLPRLRVPIPPDAGPGNLPERLAPWLPVTTQAREAALWWHQGDGARPLATFPFGTSAA